MKKIFTVLVMLVMFAGVSEAIVRFGAVPGKSGLSYSGVTYSFNSLDVIIRNSTKYNVNFGGTMVFLDKNYRVLAKAELFTAKVKRHSSRKYKAFFSEGTGEEAKNAKYLEWEF